MLFNKIKSDEDIDILVSIAHDIWSEHFNTMFDVEDLPKLIEGAQSKLAILSQIQDGYRYFFIDEEDIKIGYFAFKIDKQKNELFLSKIYIYSDQRGKGIGKKVLNHIEKVSKDAGIVKLVLTVHHKNTDSIGTYERWGFSNLGLIKRVFDNGLIVEDIKMEKAI